METKKNHCYPYYHLCCNWLVLDNNIGTCDKCKFTRIIADTEKRNHSNNVDIGFTFGGETPDLKNPPYYTFRGDTSLHSTDIATVPCDKIPEKSNELKYDIGSFDPELLNECPCGKKLDLFDTLNKQNMCSGRCSAKPKCTKCTKHLKFYDYKKGLKDCFNCNL